MSTTVASGVSLSLGLLTCVVSMSSAVEAKTSNTNVCTGLEKEHDITKISSVSTCETCGPVPYESLKKARKVGDGYVLLDAEEVATASADSAEFKKKAALTAHPAEEVDLRTVNGDKLYYLKPSTGSEPVYSVLYHLVEAHSELAFLAQWTPRSKAGLFALKAFNGVLCLQERERAESVRPAPEVTIAEPDAMLAMAEQLLALPGLISPFDPTTYADKYEERIAAIVATKTPQSLVLPDAPAGTAPTGVSALSALETMLAEAQALVAAADAKPAARARAPRAKKEAAA